MQEHQMFLWEIYTLAAFIGSPVFLLGAAAQSWLLLRRTTIGNLRTVAIVLLSITGEIILAVWIWGSPFFDGLDERRFMLLNFVNMPALLSTLILLPLVTLMALLTGRPREARG